MHSNSVSNLSQRIVHDQINNSQTKQQFTFPKTQRFDQPKTSYCDQGYYGLGSTLNKRSTNMGFGTKCDFTKGDLNKPGPDRYSVISVFSQDNSKKRGCTFSLGRDEIKFRQLQQTSQVPGPGQYEIDEGEKHRTCLYSMGERINNPFQSSTTKSTPGPGSYDSQGLSQTGFYFVSKYNCSKATVFSPPTSIRFSSPQSMKQNPGPGMYAYETIKGEGKYFNSKLRSAAGGHFSIEPRKFSYKNSSSQVPGPGQYRVLSEFGDIEFPPIPASPGKTTSKQVSQQKKQHPMNQISSVYNQNPKMRSSLNNFNNTKSNPSLRPTNHSQLNSISSQSPFYSTKDHQQPIVNKEHHQKQEVIHQAEQQLHEQQNIVQKPSNIQNQQETQHSQQKQQQESQNNQKIENAKPQEDEKPQHQENLQENRTNNNNPGQEEIKKDSETIDTK